MISRDRITDHRFLHWRVAAVPGDMPCAPRSAQLVGGNWFSALTITAVASGMRVGHWY
jgi:hypothetical protein